MAIRSIALSGAAAAAALAVGASALGQAKGGPAVYWMSADTLSGLGAMAGGGKPGAGALMGAMMGRGGASQARTLTLQLGSPQRAAGVPSAEHIPPGGLLAGPSLPLLTPQAARATGPVMPWSGQMEKPRGRMLIYWGCGEHARAGQPAVIDFASMSAGKLPPAFASTMLKPMVPPSAAAFATS
jgi:hypothetical protein